MKPQVAFFERHGSAGYDALERTLAAARDAGLIVIADAKRGDLGTSVEAYAQSWLTPGAPLEADAMTVSAFQGVGSLSAPMVLAGEHDKGLFVLAATSNPESFAIQTALVGSGENATLTVAASIVADVNKSNQAPLGSFGVVIGATVTLSNFGLTERDLTSTPILAPGFGFQGAGFDSLRTTYGVAAANTVVSSSARNPRGWPERNSRGDRRTGESTRGGVFRVSPRPDPPAVDRVAASQAAVAARRARAAVKHDIATHTRTARDVLDTAWTNPQSAEAGLRVRELLTSVPTLGPVRAAKVMTELGIAESKRAAGLGIRQRSELWNYLLAREGGVAPGRLVVLAGPTAVGKGSVSAYIRENYPEIHLSVSATTRPPRPGEVDGVHYYFVSDAEFDRMIAAHELAGMGGGAQLVPLRNAETAD